MSIYNTIQRHLIREETSFTCGNHNDDSRHISINQHNVSRNSKIDVVFLFDGTGNLLEGIEVHERPLDTTSKTQLLSTI